MSLKTRLRIAIATLMSAVVVVLSVIYIQEFLNTIFERTNDIANSISGQVQSAALDELKARRIALKSTPMSTAELKRFWTETIETDPAIAKILSLALENWSLISEIYIEGEDGLVLASSDPVRVGKRPSPAVEFSEWRDRSLMGNVRQVFLQREDTERVRPIGIEGEEKPVLTVHVVISSALLRSSLDRPLEKLGFVFLISLITAIVLAILLPNVVVDPLERLAARLDIVAAGKFADAPAPKREAKEFAAVYSKLNLLGQQFQGARENAADLRTNVEHLLERLEQAVLLVDPNGRLMMAGRNVGALLGVDPDALNGRMLTDIFPVDSEIGRAIADMLNDGNASEHEAIASVMTPDGERMLSVAVEPLQRSPQLRAMGTMITLRDAETRGELAAELGIAGRLSALSQLTRGVAHEIKNPLNAITLHLEILRGKLDGSAPELEVIRKEISRLDRVVKTFLDFNRPVEPQMRRMDLSELARELGKLIEPHAASKQIEVRIVGKEMLPIEGDPDLLKQAALNVVMNAIDAMPGGGLLTLTSYRAANSCCMAIADTGAGIPPEVQNRIFNLYFTTKDQGSGIGLAMAFRFTQLHNGRLEFSSEPGRGTTFRFIFPEAVSASRGPHLAISHSSNA
jgi:signal transduction histidine kinase